MMHRLRLLPTFLVLAISGPLQGAAEVKSSKEIKVGFVVELDGADRISGTAFCKTGDTCRLVEQKSPKLILDLKVHSFYSEMEIDCQDDCSLPSGRRAITFDNTREFHISEGETGVLTQSVFRRWKRVGKIVLDFSYPKRATRW
ncbi:hypothetical protein [Agrobacterium arsenijevicii]|uniref:Uncharacterized protein n=1 Tax=Agrobacterium arsenijevicii TaxID=1585697 RepID=A0ABR5DAJ4_9HYPH|nr:hypothetical protein RP75_08505 [Agrobacterium arsenijevicii]